MNQAELKMQPTIHLERKAEYGSGKYPALPSKCIVGCIFNCVGLIITRKSPCMFSEVEQRRKRSIFESVLSVIQTPTCRCRVKSITK
jgi:hypothetical protein